MKKFLKKNIYRLVLSNESRLENVFKVRFSLLYGLILLLIILFVISFIIFLIFYFTPAKRLLQFDFSEKKSETIDNILKIDSLQNQLELNQKYLNNIITILNTDRIPSDSTKMAANPSPLSIDSLLPRSKEEDNFIKEMKEREKYNISILAPLAAEGMIFNMPSDAATISESSKNSNKAAFLLIDKQPILAIADGVVIDTYYSNSDGGFCIIIQHSKGFISRYSHLGSLMIKKGDSLSAGQAIAFPHTNTGKLSHLIYLEMWRNGSPLVPYSVISGSIPHKSNSTDENANEG